MKQNLKRLLVLVMVLASLTALFACNSELTITYSANGGVFADGSTEKTATIASGAVLNKPEEPTKDGFFFSGWSLDEEGKEIWDFAADKIAKSITLYAVWSETPVDNIPGYGESNGPAVSENGETDKIAGKTPAQLYELSLANVEKLTNYAMTINVLGKMTSGEMVQTYTQYFLIETDGKNQHVAIESNFGEEYKAEAWYVDEVLYSVSGEDKIMMNITYEQYSKELNLDSIYSQMNMDDSLQNLPEEWFDNAVFKKDENGDFSVELKISKEDYAKAFEDGMLTDALEDGANLVYKIDFSKSGTLKKIEANISATLNGVTQELSMAIEFSEIDSTTVKAPDAKDFESVDSLYGDSEEDLYPEDNNGETEKLPESNGEAEKFPEGYDAIKSEKYPESNGEAEKFPEEDKKDDTEKYPVEDDTVKSESNDGVEEYPTEDKYYDLEKLIDGDIKYEEYIKPET